MARGQIELIDLTGDDEGVQPAGAYNASAGLAGRQLHPRRSSGARDAAMSAAAQKRRRCQGAAEDAAAQPGQISRSGGAQKASRSRGSTGAASSAADTAVGGSVARSSSSAKGSPAADKQPKAKRQKKEPAEKRQNEFGRTVPFSRGPSQKIQERMMRALPGSGHRMCVLEQRTVAGPEAPGGPVEEYALLGATGNVYTVRIGRHPSCSCPDAAKGNVCKHHLYIMMRVLRLAPDDPCVWQRALLSAEAREVLSGQRSGREVGPATEADPRLRAAYLAATAGSRARTATPAASTADAPARPQRPIEGDCPICFDELADGGDGSAAQKTVISCGTCHNYVHKDCFASWVKAKGGQAVTCVYCRSPWPNAHADAGLRKTSAAGAGRRGGGSHYLNLSQESQDHAGADTSLDALYGANALWIRHHQGSGSRFHAARMWNALR